MTTRLLKAADIVPDGGIVSDVTFTTTAVIYSKVASNRGRRAKTTFICSSSHDGTWVIYDVDSSNRAIDLNTISVTGGTNEVWSYNHIGEYFYTTFTPASSPGTETLVVRILPGGVGMGGV